MNTKENLLNTISLYNKQLEKNRAQINKLKAEAERAEASLMNAYEKEIKIAKNGGDPVEFTKTTIRPLRLKKEESKIKATQAARIQSMIAANLMLSYYNYYAYMIQSSGVLNKYINKPLGDRTREKLSNDLAEVLKPLKCGVYINFGKYASDNHLNICLLDDNGYYCNGSDIKIYDLFTIDGNKIIAVSEKAPAYYHDKYNIKEFITDYDAVIEKENQLKISITEKYEELKKLIDTYNDCGLSKHTYIGFINNL